MKYKLLDLIKEYLTGDWSGEEANQWYNRIEDELAENDFYASSGWDWDCGDIVEQSEPWLDREWYRPIDAELKAWYLKACEQVGDNPGL